MIPYSRQDILPEDIDRVVEVLRSDFLTQGPVVPEFEAVVANQVGANHAIAVNSATSALHIACLALGLGSGDWLWTSPITFVASANCGLYCGARVDFVDIDPRTYNLCPIALKQKLEIAKVSGQLPKIVVAVHLSGQSCDMQAIQALSQEYGFRVIEDASHAIGGKYQGAFVGCGQYSDITVFSFHPVKIVTTAEGGMAVTNDAGLADHMQLLRSHGITKDIGTMLNESHGPWYYEQQLLGFNYRITDLQAGLGVAQMSRLESYIKRRNQLADRYDDAFSNLPVTIPWHSPDCYSARHLYILRLKLDEISRSHQEIFEFLRSSNIAVNLHYIPVYKQPYYLAMDFEWTGFPEAENYYAEAISLPMYPSLADDDQAYVVDAVTRAVLG